MTPRTDPFGTVIIDLFLNENFFLSNFYVGAPITWNGHRFDTSEHAYQWAKTNDLNEKENILFRWIETPNGGVTAVPTSAGQAKRAGARCTLREDWENVKNNIMLDILRAKFTQHAELRQKLLATGDAILIEGNTWHDNYWGTCRCEKCGDKGTNVLGAMLMQVREELRSGHFRFAYLGTPVATDDKL